ncbi:L-type lectin-domain containing receptor kinase IX.1-like [Rhododendron vialii]|uniref:L-type lectin-domain containing receptor kinase IX.1-like n=1 Tax=Rhododendron vialii TaxID=182163 RepID=UPI00265DA060|nr:L-type lectin-domain containing receptor kinase IX.1-like [Rhododendron vialii]
MALSLCNSKSPTHFQIQHSQPILFLFLLFPFANSISFNFPNFNPNDPDIYYQGDAFEASEVIQLTKNQADGSLSFSVGRATYAQAMHLWDSETGNFTDFNTQFTFNIRALNLSTAGDGLAFFLSPFDATIPDDSSGGCLGLFDNSLAFNHTNNQIVAVEFDSFKNTWDPSADHVGIDINSIVSVANVTWNTSMKNGTTANAWVNYNSTTTTLSVYLTYAENPVFQGNYSLSYVVNFTKVLPEWVSVGFSAATGDWTEIHNIVSWSFNSTLGGSHNSTPGGSNNSISGPPPPPPPSTSNNSTIGPPPSTGTGLSTGMGHKIIPRLVIGLAMIIGTLSCGVGLFWFMKWQKINSRGNNEMGIDASTDDDDDFEKGTGPRRFTFHELSHATNNFFEGGKLGQGGFGGVYKGVLSGTQEEIAVKRISKGSKQGKKEFKSEVKTISRLRHRNLVQLIGWCHERGEFLLIYEFMPNGSLDNHLFDGKSKLRWTVRYKIALDLASAILYLHEEWEQCVVHRDIKSSNIMLDSNYNAKLGDFGLARLVDHESGLETTVMAGTMGYLAPECVSTGKASKESDIFSFGIVALEIACGRKPVERNRNLGEVVLLEWVWSLYGKGQLFEAIDKDLTMEYDKHQVERLMLVGLWCCYPDFKLRPSIRQAINSLKFEAPLPVLPSQMPVPVYFSPSMCMPSYTSSVVTTDSDINGRIQCSSSSHARSNYSSVSVESSKAPLLLHEDNEESILL